MSKQTLPRPPLPDYVTVYDDSGPTQRHSREAITAGFCGAYCGEYLAEHPELSKSEYDERFQGMYAVIYHRQKERAEMIPPWATWPELLSFAIPFNRPYDPQWDDDPD